MSSGAFVKDLKPLFSKLSQFAFISDPHKHYNILPGVPFIVLTNVWEAYNELYDRFKNVPHLEIRYIRMRNERYAHEIIGLNIFSAFLYIKTEHDKELERSVLARVFSRYFNITP
jgi:hypothetical protein